MVDRCVTHTRIVVFMLLGVLLHSSLQTINPFASGALPSATLNPDTARVGEKVIVQGSGVPGGYTAYIYWDAVKPWDGETGILNASKSRPSGSFSMSFKVPETIRGAHSVWVGSSTGQYSQIFFEVKPSLIPSDPVVIMGEVLEVKGLGFGNASDVVFIMSNSDTPFDSWPTASVTQIDYFGTVVKDTLEYSPVKPGSASFTCGSEILIDNGDGSLTSVTGGTGTINYVTGRYTLRFSENHPPNALISNNYDYFKSIQSQVTVLSERAATNSIGSFSKALSFRAVSQGEYRLAAMDSSNNTQLIKLLLCPPIILSKSIVDVGDIISVKGSGFPPEASLTATLEDEHLNCYPCNIVQGAAVDGEGGLSLTLTVPQVPVSGFYMLKVKTATMTSSQRMLQVDELASLSLSLQSRGDDHSVSLQGYNFPNLPDHIVTITLVDVYEPETTLTIGTVKTNQQGEITTSFSLKLSGGASYKVIASSTDKTVFAEAPFQITPLKVQLSSLEAEPDTIVKLTGSGFTHNSYWNASIGGIQLVSSTQGTTTSKGTLKLGTELPSFKIPSLEAGYYLLVVTDIATGLKFSTSFHVLPATQSHLINTVYPVPQLTFKKIIKEGEQTFFDASTSHDPDGAIIYYKIEFGDGSTSNNNEVQHTYIDDGVYKVRLTVRDNKGAESVLEDIITVEDTDPVAGFSASRRFGYKPLTIQFIDKSTSHDGLVSRHWAFGDGATSQEAEPYHTYLEEGAYTVALVVREGDGDEAVFTDTGCVRVIGDDRQPPVIHHMNHFRTVDGLILEVAVVDNSDIKSVALNVPGLKSLTLTEHPSLPGLYRTTLPDMLEAVVTVTAEDFNGNRVEEDWVIKTGEIRTSIYLEAGWNRVEVPVNINLIMIKDLVDAITEASNQLELYQEARGLVSSFQSYRVVSIWTYDEFRGYLFYDAASDYGEIDHIESGRVYWIEVEGSSFNKTPLEAHVVYS